MQTANAAPLTAPPPPTRPPPAVPMRALAPLARRAASRGATSAAAPADAAGAAAAPPVLLVESPVKAAKLRGYLGDRYQVLASCGHVRDLPAKAGSVDPKAGFAMRWAPAPRAAPRVEALAAAVAAAGGRLVLATDPDREGEAIAWHACEVLRELGALAPGAPPPLRATFTEVTRPAVEAALAAPRELAAPLVDAYLARRALDYLFGFRLSPLLWRRLPGARSAGRVQSAALALVAAREAEVEAFAAHAYWTVGATIKLPHGSGEAAAALVALDGAPPPRPGFGDEATAHAAAARVAAATFFVASAMTREARRTPPPPFVTSTLQQEANKRLGMGAEKTMQLAQALYEGGHITYMRTNGTFIAPEAAEALRAAAAAAHGAAAVPPAPRVHAPRGKAAQEAHEAIRPTDPARDPAALTHEGVEPAAVRLYTCVSCLESSLCFLLQNPSSSNHFADSLQMPFADTFSAPPRRRSLIRARALASQMADACVALARAEFADAASALVLRATASHVVFAGWQAAWSVEEEEEEEEGEKEEEEEAKGIKAGVNDAASAPSASPAARRRAAAALAALAPGGAVAVSRAAAPRHETRPPARFTEGTLVKTLDAVGVGRPSTFAVTMRLLRARGYVERAEGRVLRATPLGRCLAAFLGRGAFARYVDAGFTASMEASLDEVAAGRDAGWAALVGGFWGPFDAAVAAGGEASGAEVIDALNADLARMLFGVPAPAAGDDSAAAAALEAARKCPVCASGRLSLKLSHRGAPFVGCGAHPACSFARPIEGPPALGADGAPEAPEVHAGIKGAATRLGEDPATGRGVFLRAGPHGQYTQLGADGDGAGAVRRAALPRARCGAAAPATLEAALAALAAQRPLGAHPGGGEVELRAGRYGPYVRWGAEMRAVPKGADAAALSLADALELLAAPAPARRRAEPAAAAKPKRAPKAEAKAKAKAEKLAPKKETKAAAAKKEKKAAAAAPAAKRAQSAYALFVRDASPAVRAELAAEGAPARDALARVAARWRALPAEEATAYAARAAAAKAAGEEHDLT
jgi:DNA topoisomerase-1